MGLISRVSSRTYRPDMTDADQLSPENDSITSNKENCDETKTIERKNTHDDSDFDLQKSDLHGKSVDELEKIQKKISSDTSIKVSKNFRKKLTTMIEWKKGKGLELKKA